LIPQGKLEAESQENEGEGFRQKVMGKQLIADRRSVLQSGP